MHRTGRTTRRCAAAAPVVALAAALAGCGSEGSRGPCDDEDCSGAGYCYPVADIAYCVCRPGTHPVGLECDDDDPTDPCAGVDCSGHGDCRIESGRRYCECDDGYLPMFDLNCVFVPPEWADAGADADVGGFCGDRMVNGTEECDGNTESCGLCGERTCLSDCTWPVCDDPPQIRVCDQCPDGCADVRYEQDAGCGCVSRIPTECVAVGTDYCVGCEPSCGGSCPCASECRYLRRRVTTDCNCRMECPPP